ncbi:MAG: hypothetical protein D4R77_13530 [Planctomycetaceae bacterium]|nr:MAG: hypothetical protein D4R77_13530 [Planctomycetaceae bacterium]
MFKLPAEDYAVFIPEPVSKKSFFQCAFTNAQECSLLRLFLQSHWNRVFLLSSFVFFSHTKEQFLA